MQAHDSAATGEIVEEEGRFLGKTKMRGKGAREKKGELSEQVYTKVTKPLMLKIRKTRKGTAR